MKNSDQADFLSQARVMVLFSYFFVERCLPLLIAHALYIFHPMLGPFKEFLYEEALEDSSYISFGVLP